MSKRKRYSGNYSRSKMRTGQNPPVGASTPQNSSGVAGDASEAILRLALGMDSYANPLARLGEGQDNLVQASMYPLTRRTQDYALMNSLYRNDWIAGRIIDTYAEDMCKNWYSLETQATPDQLKAYARAERKARVKQRVITGLKWGRLYGGAAGLLMIKGQEDMLDQPIDLDMIMPGDFMGITILDRWSGISPSTDRVEDLSDPDFGLPAYYRVSFDSPGMAKGIDIHHSRVVRFVGRELPYIEQTAEMYWGMSELEHVYDELNKRNMTSANIAQLIFQANLRILKMSDLSDALTSTSPKMQQALYRTISAQNMLMNSQGVQVLDRDDEFQTHAYTFSGLSDVYEQFMMDIAGAAEIPVTKLFGRSPAGMNATGESDMTNYYDSVLQKQEAMLRPVFDKLVPILCMSTWGAIPDDLEYEFNPVRESPEDERASITQRSTQAIVSVHNAGIISQRTALEELRRTEAMTGMWGSITDEDIANADDTTGLPEGELDLPPEGELPDVTQYG